MRIIATSDWHGELPTLPKCDLLLLVGDILPDFFPQPLNVRKNLQRQWFYGKVVPHVMSIATHTVGVWGNHDFWGEDPAARNIKILDTQHRQVTILTDDDTIVWPPEEDGTTSLHIWGVPWVTKLPRWAFNKTEQELREKLEYFPRSADIVLSHAPPLWFGDRVVSGNHVGWEGLYRWLTQGAEKVPLVLSGHIHEGFGSYVNNGVHNVAYMDEHYEPQERWLELTYDKEGLRVDRWSDEGGSGAVAGRGEGERKPGGGADDAEPQSGSEAEAAEPEVQAEVV